ncbi:MAG TPA: CDP-glycerol glycerophosphotransferase family protein [Bacteroidales bacterium]|nr:CDP-glycerol glycerophosphotransferase family protein [Bacteroidales bacterium]
MKALLFCQNPYAFSILEPLCEELFERGHEVIWFITPNLENDFPFRDKYPFTGSIEEIYKFRSDAIFAPGNEVPHYLRGVKVQIFHGFAGEKKGHFRIRHYFDLYLTQGPYFTNRFNELAKKHADFIVTETGWSKLDRLYDRNPGDSDLRNRILEKSGSRKVILYAPTFSPSLTSANYAHDAVVSLTRDSNLFLLVKFHDLTDIKIVERYRKSLGTNIYAEIVNDRDILSSLLASDLMISDTSSVVYEFLLLDKPVITINSRSGHIKWVNISDPSDLHQTVKSVLELDQCADQRKWFRDNYHPYADGRSSARMIEATEKYIAENGIPERRKLSFLGRQKINRLFGKPHLHDRI